ncbi:selenoprotein O-like [Orbicella faveolata]|uniref:selenoprotein O-like n=1 Tax=Orbicella faveolata TaxID=48498 RepID=UPI0009E482C8|nr:selenoprotein O-like [Orbicella faveolata]
MLRRGVMATLETLKFDNLALRSLPIDKETQNVIRQVEGACFTLVDPTPVRNPTLVSYSANALSLLDLPQSEVTRPEFVQYMSGNKLLGGSQTAAHCYCGHQQGYFSGQLGDGAAMYLGEVLNSKGDRWEIQLKGTGLTPFSNHRDGRKVLRSSIREFLCSEAMYHLGVPTTRAGCCVTSDTFVERDKDYNGSAAKERASLVLRIAPTFLRFGSFEIFKPADPLTGYKGPSSCRVDILHQLLGYTIKNFYPQVCVPLNKYSHLFRYFDMWYISQLFHKCMLDQTNCFLVSFVLRNYIAQRAIQAAEKGDFSVVQSILKRLETPYSDDMEDEEASFSQTTTAEPSPSLPDHRERTLFKVYDKHENFLDKPPEDVLNMQLS